MDVVYWYCIPIATLLYIVHYPVVLNNLDVLLGLVVHLRVLESHWTKKSRSLLEAEGAQQKSYQTDMHMEINYL